MVKYEVKFEVVVRKFESDRESRGGISVDAFNHIIKDEIRGGLKMIPIYVVPLETVGDEE